MTWMYYEIKINNTETC